MCGIAGIISAKLDRRARGDAVARMVHRQKHRGPDDRGCHDQGPATLGMCRLAIIDPTHGHQPMFSPDERFSLIFNGTIYNYRELQAGLAARGWIFQTQSDTSLNRPSAAPRCARHPLDPGYLSRNNYRSSWPTNHLAALAVAPEA